MDEQHLSTLRQLAQGIDPGTGEVFPDHSPYQQPRVIRALHAAVELAATGSPRNPANRATTAPAAPRAGKPWTDDEEARLLARFDAGEDAADIATALERSRIAVTARLVKLGRIDPPPDLRLRAPAR